MQVSGDKYDNNVKTEADVINNKITLSLDSNNKIIKNSNTKVDHCQQDNHRFLHYHNGVSRGDSQMLSQFDFEEKKYEVDSYRYYRCGLQQSKPGASSIKNLTFLLLFFAHIVYAVGKGELGKCINGLPDGGHTCKYYLTKNDYTGGEALKGGGEIMYEKDNGLGTQGSETLSLTRDKKSGQKTQISDGRLSYIDLNGTERGTSCKGYQLSSSNTECNNDLMISDCKYAGVNRFGGIGGVSCDSDYSFDYYGKCTSSCTEGGLTCINGYGMACNHFNGYYDISPGKGEYSSFILKSLSATAITLTMWTLI